MTRSPSRSPADARRPSSRPSVNIDPIRVLREHWKAIVGGGAIGAALGVILNFGMGAAYPIFSGEAVFEIRNRIIDGTDAVGQDYSQEEQVVRIANTEIGFMLSDRVLDAVMAAPAFRGTEYAQQFFDNGVLNTTDCLRELKSDLSASFARSSQLFVLRLSWTVREDIAPILAAAPPAVSVETVACFKDVAGAARATNASVRAAGASRLLGCVRAGNIAPRYAIGTLNLLGQVDAAYTIIGPLLKRSNPQGFLLTGGYMLASMARPMRADPRFLPLMRETGIYQYWLDTRTQPDVCETPEERDFEVCVALRKDQGK